MRGVAFMSIFDPFDSSFFGVKELDIVSFAGSLNDMHQYTRCAVCTDNGGLSDPAVVIELGKDLSRRQRIDNHCQRDGKKENECRIAGYTQLGYGGYHSFLCRRDILEYQ